MASDYPAGTVIDPDGDAVEVGVYGHLVTLRAVRRDGSADVAVHLDADLRDLAAEVATGDDAEAAKRIMGREKDRRYARRELPWEPGMLTPIDRARYDAAGMLKHGSGLLTGRVDPETGEKLDEDAD